MFTTPTSSVKRKNGFFYGLTPTMSRYGSAISPNAKYQLLFVGPPLSKPKFSTANERQ
jgi:hypothetical protein